MREITFHLGVAAERRPAASRWADEVWRAVEVCAPLPLEPGAVMAREGATARVWLGAAPMRCHATDAEIFAENLAEGGSVYVVLRERAGEPPVALHLVSASPHEAQDCEVGAEDLVERLPMPPDVAEALAGFVAQHHVPRPFKKRKRTPDDIEAHRFGQEPIFARKGRPHD